MAQAPLRSFLYIYIYIIIFFLNISLNKFSPPVSNNKSSIFSYKIIEFDGRHYDLISFELVHFLKGATSVLYSKMHL